MTTPAGPFPPDGFLLIAHRGDNRNFPENTLAAFEGALAAGADMVELDVALSADGRPVVIHDDTLDRTTSGAGRVSARTLAEIEALDAGSWFSPRFSGERAPTLEAVFRRMGGRIRINVEIKKEAAKTAGPFPDVCGQVAGLIRQHGLAGSVLVSCFDDAVLADFRRIAPEIAIGVLSDRPETPGEVLGRMEAVKAASYHQNAALLTRGVVEALHPRGLRVLAWTGRRENTWEALKKALECGADGFFADDPGPMRKLLDGWREKNAGRA